MGEPIYKIIELSGTSKTDIEGAIENAISKASETVRNLKWFEVIQARGDIEDDHVASWQVTIKKGVKPGTPFEELPDSWTCPECGAAKSEFEKTN